MGYMMQVLEQEQQEAADTAKSFPDFQAGDELEVILTVPENQRKPATVRGLCISRNNRGVRTSFTLRNFLGNAGGIERTFPLYSPHVQSIKVLRSQHVRRAKLYYLR
eukprot:jgi/Astpho2/2348/gw1.00044.155.1_t